MRSYSFVSIRKYIHLNERSNEPRRANTSRPMARLHRNTLLTRYARRERESIEPTKLLHFVYRSPIIPPLGTRVSCELFESINTVHESIRFNYWSSLQEFANGSRSNYAVVGVCCTLKRTWSVGVACATVRNADMTIHTRCTTKRRHTSYLRHKRFPFRVT